MQRLNRKDPNWVRGKAMLENINTPNDLVRLWRMYGSYNFGAPAIEMDFPWWVNN